MGSFLYRNFSEPITVNAGQIQVSVTLPKFQNKTFSAISRGAPLAKWGAAKAAVMNLKHQRNAFIQTTHNDTVKQFENIIRKKQFNETPVDENPNENENDNHQSNENWDNSYRIV